MKKKLLSIVLALSMLCAFVPLVASAEVATSGTCGENLTWTLGEDGTLTISGTGDMYDYYNDFFGQSKIKNVIIKNGVTSIGNRAFNYCRSLTSIKIPNSVKSIGDSTFEDCSSLTSVEISNSVTSIDDYMFRNCEKCGSGSVVERHLAKVNVASSNLVFRSIYYKTKDAKICVFCYLYPAP